MTDDIHATLAQARAELIEAERRYSEARERGRDVAQRQREAERRAADAEKDLARARALANTATDEHIDGSLTLKQFQARLDAVDRAEKNLADARRVVERFAQVVNRGQAVADAYHARSDAMALYAAVVSAAELDACPDLRERVLTGFASWAWGRGLDLAEVGSERGTYLKSYVADFFGEATRDEIEAGRERFESRYLADLEPDA